MLWLRLGDLHRRHFGLARWSPHKRRKAEFLCWRPGAKSTRGLIREINFSESAACSHLSGSIVSLRCNGSSAIRRRNARMCLGDRAPSPHGRRAQP